MSKKNNEEKKDIKKLILISVIVIAFIVSGIFIVMTINSSDKKKEFKIDGIEVTKNKNIIKDTKVDTLNITDQILYNRNNESVFSAIINNNNSDDYYIKELYILFDNNKILAIKDTKILANDKKVFEVSFDTDILDTTKIVYEIVK